MGAQDDLARLAAQVGQLQATVAGLGRPGMPQGAPGPQGPPPQGPSSMATMLPMMLSMVASKTTGMPAPQKQAVGAMLEGMRTGRMDPGAMAGLMSTILSGPDVDPMMATMGRMLIDEMGRMGQQQQQPAQAPQGWGQPPAQAPQGWGPPPPAPPPPAPPAIPPEVLAAADGARAAADQASARAAAAVSEAAACQGAVGALRSTQLEALSTLQSLVKGLALMQQEVGGIDKRLATLEHALEAAADNDEDDNGNGVHPAPVTT